MLPGPPSLELRLPPPTRTPEFQRAAEPTRKAITSSPRCPGSYTVRVAARGFRSAVSSDNQIGVAQTARVDFNLEVGSVTESVVVEAVAPLVQSTTSDISQSIETKQVQTLPLNGRIFSQLVNLVPGPSQQEIAMRPNQLREPEHEQTFNRA